MVEFKGAVIDIATKNNDGESISEMSMKPQEAEKLAPQLLLAAAELTAK